MSESGDILRRLLSSQEFLQALVDAVHNAREQWSYDDEAALTERIQRDRDTFADKAVKAVFRSVVARLPQPAAISEDDLRRIAEQQLAGIDFDTDFRNETSIAAMRRMAAVAVVESRAESLDLGIPSDRPIPMGRWWADSRTDMDKVKAVGDLWHSESGFSLGITATPVFSSDEFSEDPQLEHFCEVHGLLRGMCSDHAMQLAEQEVASVLPSIAKTVSTSTAHEEREKSSWGESHAELSDALSGLVFPGDPPDPPSGIPAPPSSLTPIGFVTDPDGDGRHLLASCLDAWFTRSDDRDYFQRRLANAIELLRAADDASSNGIRLALSVAAVEAIVCAKEERLCDILRLSADDKMAIDTQFKKFVSALLMPHPNGRSVRAEALYDIYDSRSKTLHGEKISGEFAVYARQIASGVLRSATHWRRHRVREGAPAEWEDLIREVHEAAIKRKQMRDVPDLQDLLLTKRHLRVGRESRAAGQEPSG
jgi:hypothetical protein